MRLYLSSCRIGGRAGARRIVKRLGGDDIAAEAEAAETVRKHSAARRVPHRTPRDGEVIVWTGPRLPVAEVQRIA